MDQYELRDLTILAAQHGIELPSRCDRETAYAVLRPALLAVSISEQTLNAGVAGALAIAALVGRALNHHDPEGFYTCLGVAPGATEEEIKLSHRAKSLLLHEDRHSGAGDDIKNLAKQMQQRVNAAKEVLSSPSTREAYHHQGMAGVARAELVSADHGTKHFLEDLDILQRRERLLRLHRELDSSGGAMVRFNGLSTFQPLTEKIHSTLLKLGYTFEEEEDYEEEYEEYEEEDEHEDEEGEEEEGEGEEGEVNSVSAGEMTIAKVDINGKPTYVIIPDEKTRLHIESAMKNAETTEEDEEAAPVSTPASALSFYDWLYLVGEGVVRRSPVKTSLLQESPPSRARKAATSVLGLAFAWPQLTLPHATQVYLNHSFSFPWGVNKLFTLSCGGPAAWVNVTYDYVAGALEEFSAKLTMKVAKTTAALSWLRKLTPDTECSLKYKVGTSAGSSKGMGFSRMQAKVDSKVGEAARLSAAVTMAPMSPGEHNKLQWEYRKWDEEGNSASYQLDIGFLSLTQGVVHRLVLPRKVAEGTSGTVEDEDEAEALSSIGSLTTMLSQDVISGTARLSWRAMFHTSKRSTRNQIGFGVSTSLPYAYAGLAFVHADSNQATTEFEVLLQRNKFSLRIPLLITTASDLPTVTSYMLLPLLVFKTGLELVKRPWDRMTRKSDFLKRRKAIGPSLWEQRKRAMSEQELLKDEAKRRADEEVGVGGGGLVIQNAKYGCLHAAPEDDEALEKAGLPPRVLVVTVALQAAVHESQLLLNAGPKHRYDGFYDVDPDSTEEKYLRVRYLFLGEPHEVELLEGMELVLPLQEHKLHVTEHESPRKGH